MVELAIDVQDAKVLVEIEMMAHVRCIQHPIELESMGLVPVFVGRADELLRTQLLRIRFYVR